jgi:hypothetical protein
MLPPSSLDGATEEAAAAATQAERNQALYFSLTLIELPRLRLRLAPVAVVANKAQTTPTTTTGVSGGDGKDKNEEVVEVRLRLLDHNGWFISDRFGERNSAAQRTSQGDDDLGPPCKEEEEDGEVLAAAASRWLDPLLKGLGECLVLESDNGEGLQLLLPNHDLHRPKVSLTSRGPQSPIERGAYH